MVHLCGRPLPNRGRCTLGRETAIQPMVWGEDGWLRTADGQGSPYRSRRAGTCAARFPAAGTGRLRRARIAGRFSVAAFPVAGGTFQSDGTSRSSAALWARDDGQSVQAGARGATATVALLTAPNGLEFEPEHFQQMAGLICYYNGASFITSMSRMTTSMGKHIRVMSCLPDQVQSDAFTRAHRAFPRRARAIARGGGFRAPLFRLPIGRRRLEPAAGHFDASILSDEAAAPGTPNFTGAFVGMGCQDIGRRTRRISITSCTGSVVIAPILSP